MASGAPALLSRVAVCAGALLLGVAVTYWVSWHVVTASVYDTVQCGSLADTEPNLGGFAEACYEQQGKNALIAVAIGGAATLAIVVGLWRSSGDA